MLAQVAMSFCADNINKVAEQGNRGYLTRKTLIASVHMAEEMATGQTTEAEPTSAIRSSLEK